MMKRMTIMLCGMAVLFGGLYGFQTFKEMMIRKAIGALANPPQTVSTVVAADAPWQSSLPTGTTWRRCWRAAPSGAATSRRCSSRSWAAA